MKLAFILYRYFPYGGLEKNCFSIANACAVQGHHVTIYTHHWSGLQPTHFNIQEISACGLSNHARLISFGKRAIEACANNYDLIIGFQRITGLDVYYCADVCFRHQCAQKYGAWYRLTPRYRAYAAMEKAVFDKRSHTQILLLSEQQKALYQQYYHTPDARFHLLPPGINRQLKPDPNSPAECVAIRKQHQVPEDETVFLFLGSDYRRKGLDRVLLGLQQVDKARLWVIGDDDPQSFKRDLAHLGLDGRVDFLGPQQHVKQYLLAADVLVHPAYFENTGNVLLEAMVAGLPVITTDNCGYAPFIAAAESGLVLASPFKQRALSQAMQTATSVAHREIWQANALNYSETQNFYSRAEIAVEVITSLKK